MASHHHTSVSEGELVALNFIRGLLQVDLHALERLVKDWIISPSQEELRQKWTLEEVDVPRLHDLRPSIPQGIGHCLAMRDVTSDKLPHHVRVPACDVIKLKYPVALAGCSQHVLEYEPHLKHTWYPTMPPQSWPTKVKPSHLRAFARLAISSARTSMS